MARVRNQANRVCQSGRTRRDHDLLRGRHSGFGLALEVARACDRFLQRRGEDTGGGLRDIIHRSAAATRLVKARQQQSRQDRADQIAAEFERSWA